jgi:hypothetical protein
VRTIKSWWLVLAFLSGFALAMWAEEVILNWRDNRLEFAAPRVHFLGGKPLELLHNAAPVPFGFQVTLFSGTHEHIFQKLTDRFVVSYDLWEEKFRVVKTQSPVRRVEHLTAPDAEKWCWDQMTMDVSGVASTEPLWVRMEIRAEDGKDGPLFGRGSVSESGISLTSLIELFSKPPRSEQSHWGPYEMGPFTIDDLKHSRRRGS